MLWAILAVNYWPREKAIRFFRYIGNYVHKYPDCYDVTISGIGRLPEERRQDFIRNITAWSTDAKDMLRPMMLFEELPAISDWKMYLDDALKEKDWDLLGEAVLKVLWHQSEEATDCRWVRLCCEAIGGKVYFLPEMKELIRGILEYPDHGDAAASIRAMEISLSGEETEAALSWPRAFWQSCFDKTVCSPEESRVSEILRPEEWDKQRGHYLAETVRIRRAIIEHFLQTSSTTATNIRLEVCFGYSLYAFTLFSEIIFYKLDYALTGRMILRSLVECLITFKYLLENDDGDMWKSFRAYGSGQAKLIYLKMQELKSRPSSINVEKLEMISNEDMWLELVPINLGNWGSTDLRRMSNDVGLKDIYDQYYDWTSGFIHANWSAIRETVYSRCFNPVHRLHRLPTAEFPLGAQVTQDALSLTNMIFELLGKAYPSFPDRIREFSVEISGQEGHS
jgi:hypothetical protein